MQNTEVKNLGEKILKICPRESHQKLVYYLYKEVSMEEYDDDLFDEMLEGIIEKAFENSYMVLTNKISFTNLVKNESENDSPALMIYDPVSGIGKDQLEGMIDYFLGMDEPEYYLRCGELKKIMDELTQN